MDVLELFLDDQYVRKYFNVIADILNAKEFDRVNRRSPGNAAPPQDTALVSSRR